MRPEILFDLFAPVTSLEGIGSRLARLIEKLAGPRRIDLLWHLPTGLIDRRFAPRLADAPPDRVITVTVRVVAHQPPRPGGRQPYKVYCEDGSGGVWLVFFHARADYLARLLPEGETRVVSGTISRFGDALQMTHPDYVVAPAEANSLPVIEPVYPLTAGLSNKVLAKAITAVLAEMPALPEWQDPAFLARKAWPAWADAIDQAHHPSSEAALAESSPARARLAYDELLANQLALGMIRDHMKRSAGRRIQGDGSLRAAVRDGLPFPLTGSQAQAVAEIVADMAAPARMLRLLQGDVGSGKTVVALLVMAEAVAAGCQAAFMAPTELLARQHHATLQSLAGERLRIGLLTGRDKGSARDALVAAAAAGEVDVLVGTHALFQKDVTFRDLALAVIDEQHKFGVHQRLDLQAKGGGVDVLVMTATPIPRTLMLTAYGDMAASRLTDKPPGRQPVQTVAMPLSRLPDVVAAVGRAIDRGEQVYWVCPLVAESETVDLAAAEDRAAALRQSFGDSRGGARVGLVHGRMKSAERDQAMQAFVAGEIGVLVATTVIEVGVDVANATVMVVEHAERFGLAQLHQLRGRVGRGPKPSHCLLVYAPPLGKTAAARLGVMRRSDDGFLIAEEDLKLRGAGDLLGTRQSGLPAFKLADPVHHRDLMQAADDDARLILARDPHLQSPRGKSLRVLLYLFERDAAVSLLRSG